ncbi:MAG: stage II sporulation protein R [Clostridia bacterium]|nr:stage II sporulation protein R [Clostridia bacterium]MBQ7289173.1 stage II sporulation protein R [Clostridia bacterium]
MSSYKHICISAVCGLLVALCVAVAGFQADCTAIRENTFRLHIIANSDSADDQNIKLAVRDAIQVLAEDLYEKCENQEQAKKQTVLNLKNFETKANEVLQAAGFAYTATAMVGTVSFNTREYEDFTLPAGEYEALEIVLGAGQGKNWWCVMYPKVCFSTCSEDFDSVLEERQQEIVTDRKKYRVAFRMVEIFDDVKRFFKKYL